MRTITLSAATLMAAVSALGAVGAGTSGRVVDAVRNGDRAALQALLKQHADVDIAEPDGTTALVWAVRQGDAKTVDLLLAAGGNVKAANHYGVSPLLVASEEGDAGIIGRLLKAGADANSAGPDGETALMLAARTGKVDAIKLLASHGANVNAKESFMGETPLIWAAAENNADAVRMLVEFGANVNMRSAPVEYPKQDPADPDDYVPSAAPKGDWTPLMYAARQGALDAARALIDLGADMNVRDPEGMTPLIEAIVNMHLDFAAALIEKGADVNLADSSGMTPLFAAIDMHTPAYEKSRPDPKENDQLNCLGLMKVLLDHGANPNAALTGRLLQRYHAGGPGPKKVVAGGMTPLMRAALHDNLDMVRLLVERGADVKVAEQDGGTALMFATGIKFAPKEGDPPNQGSPAEALEIVKLFIEKGADVNARNDKGETALYAAAFVGHYDQVISYLVEHGARPDVKTKQGLTLMDAVLNTGIADDGDGHRVDSKPGPETITLVRGLMESAGVKPTVRGESTAQALPARPATQTIAPGR